MSARLLIVTDAWHPQTNGVVRSLHAVGDEFKARGWVLDYLTPAMFWRLPMPTYPEIELALAPRRAIGTHIARFRPDHIHIATEGPLGFQARLYCEQAGLAFTSSYHTRFPEYLAARAPIPEHLSYAYLRWFHSGASATLVPTKTMAKTLKNHGFSRVKVWTRGVNAQLFTPGPKTRFVDWPAPHLLYVGRVAVEKNIEAFLKLKTAGTKIVVGDGPQRDEVQRAYPEVKFLGPQRGAELTALYQSADVFVFPSRTDTFGNVIIEALSCGVPVAAYPVCGPIDILTDPQCGALDEDLGQAVAQALTLSPEAARRHAGNFTWSRCADLMCENFVPAHPVQPTLTDEAA